METENKMVEGFDDYNIQTPSIKIIKNTKGYNFEFKLTSLDLEEMDRIHNGIVDKIKEWESQNDRT